MQNLRDLAQDMVVYFVFITKSSVLGVAAEFIDKYQGTRFPLKSCGNDDKKARHSGQAKRDPESRSRFVHALGDMRE